VKWVIAVAALIGLVLSTVSLINHYKKSETEYCDFSAAFNCDLVNRSIYSEIGGNLPDTITDVPRFISRFPVAGVGMLGYAVLLVLAFAARRSALWFMLLCALIGLAFAARLTYVEARLLGVFCILCLGSQLMILLIAIVAGIRAFQRPMERTFVVSR
jgi:uncharacterized membrane protein